jgi:DNA polymerase III subunit epsilon
MREIVLDTETTGLSARKGDRVIEIGCVEIVNRAPTGREFHVFLNPEREVPAEAQAIHGISTDFLRDKPLFKKISTEFLTFIAGDPLIIHNAAFDIEFLNMELERIGQAAISLDRVVDTLMLARRKHPVGPNTLDGLCKRYGVDNSKRTKHGALMDSLLLAEVYVELLGEKQAALSLHASPGKSAAGNGVVAKSTAAGKAQQRSKPLASRITDAEREAHRDFIGTLGPKAIWHKIWPNAG